MIKRNLLKFGVVVMASACMVGCGSKATDNKPVETTTGVVAEVETTTTPEVETTTPVETEKPTEAPTQEPTVAPTQEPTVAPTEKPTEAPTQKPTEAPTQKPTEKPTQKPTEKPTETPTMSDFEKEFWNPTLDDIYYQKPTTDIDLYKCTRWGATLKEGITNDELLTLGHTSDPNAFKQMIEISTWQVETYKKYSADIKKILGREPSDAEFLLYLASHLYNDVGFIYGSSSNFDNDPHWNVVYGDHKGNCVDYANIWEPLYYMHKISMNKNFDFGYAYRNDHLYKGASNQAYIDENLTNHWWGLFEVDGEIQCIDSWFTNHGVSRGTKLWSFLFDAEYADIRTKLIRDEVAFTLEQN